MRKSEKEAPLTLISDHCETLVRVGMRGCEALGMGLLICWLGDHFFFARVICLFCGRYHSTVTDAMLSWFPNGIYSC
jgi:hypothetical protein